MPVQCSSELREQIENTIRFLAVDAVEAAGCGHPGAPMGLAAAGLEIFDQHLRFDPSDPDWPLRDRFVLSGGHASMLLYALLHLFGYDLSLDDIREFRQLDSKTPGHPEYGHTPGVETTTGPLGQGFANAVGMALAGRLTRARFGGEASSEAPGLGHHFVYGMMGDGDMMEGVAGEAASLAGHLGLGNLIFVYDSNKITIDGSTDLSFSEDTAAIFRARGWHVVESIDGQDVLGLRSALQEARNEVERPSLIVLETVIGRGSPNVAGRSKAHGAKLGAEEVALTKQALGWPEEPTFLIPEAVQAYCAERVREKQADRAEADVGWQAWRAAHPERAAEWDAIRDGKFPDDLGVRLAEGRVGVTDATRNHSKAVLTDLAEIVPQLIGGSADLAGSAAPPILAGRGVVGPGADQGLDPFEGRNIHFGVREHAMAAITNGIALDGTFIPYCGTFLIFSDYMRPSLRLAALMKLRSLFVFTHDSFFVGEDGPTHQPVEQVDSLDAMPGLTIFRPADGVETAMAYAWALQKAEGPVALSLSRQGLPALERPEDFDLKEIHRGAYSVRQTDGKPDVLLLASGSEVALCLETAEQLATAGIQASVVSMPSLELFQSQSEADQLALIPDDGTPVVAVEAGCGERFRRYVGRRGLIHGIQHFGESAPYKQLAERFGFTPAALSQRVREHLGRV